MVNHAQKYRVANVVVRKVMSLVLLAVFFAPYAAFSAGQCDQILEQANQNNQADLYSEVLKCELGLDETSNTFASAEGATIGSDANLNPSSITGGDITLNPPSSVTTVNDPVISNPGLTVVSGIPGNPVGTSPLGPTVILGTPLPPPPPTFNQDMDLGLVQANTNVDAQN